MPLPELVLRGRRVLTPGGEARPAAVHVARGVIVAVTAYDDLPAGVTPVEVGDAVLMPGVVDSHVHVNEPGRTAWEGFATATRAAAAGGVTTLVDMPLNSIPATTSVASLHAKAAAAEGHCHVDVGLWGGAVPGNAMDLRRMLDAGALGFECFMVDSGVAEFPPVTEGDLRAAMGALADSGAALLVHAEFPGPIEAAARALGAFPDPRSYARYLASRPMAAEDEAIALLAALCRETRARVHVVHLSSSGALPVLRAARDEALPLSAETTPHYLHFAAEEVPDGATAFKCAPPIRDAANREKLWQALGEGLIATVVSDHSPCTPELKKLDRGDFGAAWGGIASLQFGLAITWTAARRRGHTLADLARWLCDGTARLAGLHRRKGAIAVGRDADFVVWRPEESFTVEPGMIEHRHKVTPYLGQRLDGVVEGTWVRGRKVYERGRAAGAFLAAPAGAWLKRGAV